MRFAVDYPKRGFEMTKLVSKQAKDLKRLLQMYQFWAVKMYPRSDFRETTEKVEKLCRSRRMQVGLRRVASSHSHAHIYFLHVRMP
jgi:hypothetical protein